MLGLMSAQLVKPAVLVAAALIAMGCDTATDPRSESPPGTEMPAASDTSAPSATLAPSPTSAAAVGGSPTPSTEAAPRQEPATFDPAAARATIELLAGQIGPREATGAGFAAAADEVQRRLAALGYVVTRQQVPVPAGESWGVPVPSGDTANLVAAQPGVDVTEPVLVVGAHLDTVPQAPGAVDNASGIAVLLEVARMATVEPPPQPVVFIAFGAEEPRGPGDDLHHFGSQAFVAQLTPQQRDRLIGAIAIDSVGISDGVPICSATGPTDAFAQGVRDAAQQAGIPVRACENRTSDHWSFVRNGLAGVRIGLAGQTEYAEYHSAADTPDVVDDTRVAQAGEAVWAAISRAW